MFRNVAFGRVLEAQSLLVFAVVYAAVFPTLPQPIHLVFRRPKLLCFRFADQHDCLSRAGRSAQPAPDAFIFIDRVEFLAFVDRLDLAALIRAGVALFAEVGVDASQVM